jgi:hypothetical protein
VFLKTILNTMKVFVRNKLVDGKCLIDLIGCVEQGSNRLFVRMSQLHISLHFDLARVALILSYPISIVLSIRPRIGREPL